MDSSSKNVANVVEAEVDLVEDKSVYEAMTMPYVLALH